MNNDSRKDLKTTTGKLKQLGIPAKRIVATILFSAAVGTMFAGGGGYKPILLAKQTILA